MSKENIHPHVLQRVTALSNEITVARDDDTPDGRAKKYLVHKNAHSTLKYSLATQNYVAAFLLAFSLLEDRVRAMFVVLKRDVNKEPVHEVEIRQRITDIFAYLHNEGAINSEQKNELRKLFRFRNKLAHSSMWHLHAFRYSDVQEAMSMHRKISNLTERLKRQVKRRKNGDIC